MGAAASTLPSKFTKVHRQELNIAQVAELNTDTKMNLIGANEVP
jgi:hypothetical protein